MGNQHGQKLKRYSRIHIRWMSEVDSVGSVNADISNLLSVVLKWRYQRTVIWSKVRSKLIETASAAMKKERTHVSRLLVRIGNVYGVIVRKISPALKLSFLRTVICRRLGLVGSAAGTVAEVFCYQRVVVSRLLCLKMPI
jgi:hypothetical protein